MSPFARYVQCQHGSARRLGLSYCLLWGLIFERLGRHDTEPRRLTVQSCMRQHAAGQTQRDHHVAIGIHIHVECAFENDELIARQRRAVTGAGKSIRRRRLLIGDALIRIRPIPQLDEAVVRHEQLLGLGDA